MIARDILDPAKLEMMCASLHFAKETNMEDLIDDFIATDPLPLIHEWPVTFEHLPSEQQPSVQCWPLCSIDSESLAANASYI